MPEPELKRQASRCMGCGVPFCNDACPLGNLIPDWNDLVRTGKWREAIDQLHATNNFPEFTGLVCPAPCESACVLAINDESVTIKQVEYAIVERAFDEGWITPQVPDTRTGQHVAVIGSGPAGIACRPGAQPGRPLGHGVRARRDPRRADALRRPGREAREVDDRQARRRVRRGGDHVRMRRRRRRLGHVGRRALRPVRRRRDRDGLARRARHRGPGRELDGVHVAMDYLYQRNRFVARRSRQPLRPDPESWSSGCGQGRRRDRRRRHGDGLRLERHCARERADALLLDVYPDVPKDGRYPNTPWPHPLSRLSRRTPSTRAASGASPVR